MKYILYLAILILGNMCNHHLTHWGQVMHICVGKLTIIGSDNGLSPGRRQAIIRTNAMILLIGTLGTNFSEVLSEIHTLHLKMSSGRWWPFCLGLNVLTTNYNQYEAEGNKHGNIRNIPRIMNKVHVCNNWTSWTNGQIAGKSPI